MGANSFLQELTTIEKGFRNENCRVAFPKSVPIHLNAYVKCAYSDKPAHMSYTQADRSMNSSFIKTADHTVCLQKQNFTVQMLIR